MQFLSINLIFIIHKIIARYRLLEEKMGLGQKVWEERNEKNISKSPNPIGNNHFQ